MQSFFVNTVLRHAALFPLWKELLRQEDAVEKHMSAQRSRICAIRAPGCATVCIVPELISFDDLRDKFLPPGLGSRATHYGN